jgi:hypothetical protein
MAKSLLQLDHIVISAMDLETGSAWAQEILDVPLQQGGEHQKMGTHNRLLSLGPSEYLEVVAINPSAPHPGRPRWIDLDRFRGPPSLTNWMCAVDDLEAVLQMFPKGIGEVLDFQRGDFRWKMAVPTDGILPFENAFPALLQWGDLHPAPKLVDHGYRLRKLTIGHPEAPLMDLMLTPALRDPRIHFEYYRAKKLIAEIDTPQGIRTLQ